MCVREETGIVDRFPGSCCFKHRVEADLLEAQTRLDRYSIKRGPTAISHPEVSFKISECPFTMSKKHGKQREKQKRPDREDTGPKAVFSKQGEEDENREHR